MLKTPDSCLSTHYLGKAKGQVQVFVADLTRDGFPEIIAGTQDKDEYGIYIWKNLHKAPVK